jgi:hypothetical protein
MSEKGLAELRGRIRERNDRFRALPRTGPDASVDNDDFMLAVLDFIAGQSQTQTEFVCPHCGAFSQWPLDSLDSGTTLTCTSCNQPCVVMLCTPAEYAMGTKAIAERNAP